jgi:hypothetical protein
VDTRILLNFVRIGELTMLIAMKGFVDLVQNNTNNENNWMVDLKIFNKNVKFRVDSGADVNVIPFSVYK